MGFELRFTDTEITTWDGMALTRQVSDHLRVEQMPASCGLPQQQSNHRCRPEQLNTQFMLSIWCVAKLLEHGDVTGHDLAYI